MSKPRVAHSPADNTERNLNKKLIALFYTYFFLLVLLFNLCGFQLPF